MSNPVNHSPTNAAKPAVDQTSNLLPLNVSELGYSANGRALLQGINFTISTPGISIIMGANGSGKSLLVRLLHGLILPSSGSISWGKMAMSDRLRKQQAMVFQKPVLLRRSVAANMNFVLRLKNRANRKELCHTLLDEAGLLAHANQPARRLSGGEQQRLALARALALEPKVLLLDEPSASLDPASTAHIERRVIKAAEMGIKIILVTHDAAQARRLASDIVFLHNGQLCEHNGAQEFFKQPQSDAAQAYLEGRIVL